MMDTAPQTETRPAAPPAAYQPPVSVVIATYNRGAVLFDTIEMVMRNEYPDFELLVVDQTPSPSDEYRERMEALRRAHGFTYLTLKKPSLTFARNAGLRRAKGDVIIFIDDDVEMEPDFIASHVAPYADPTVGAVAGRVYSPKYGIHKADYLDYVSDEPIAHLRADGSFETNLHIARRADVDFGMGANMSFRKEALLDVDGHDERYTGGFYREDGDIFARVKKTGRRVVFEPDAAAVHLESDGGSRTDRGRKDLKRQYSVFRNETIFFLNCEPGAPFPRFAYRMLRWTYAVKVTKGYSWRDFFYLAGAFFGGIKAFYFEHPKQLTRRYDP